MLWGHCPRTRSPQGGPCPRHTAAQHPSLLAGAVRGQKGAKRNDRVACMCGDVWYILAPRRGKHGDRQEAIPSLGKPGDTWGPSKVQVTCVKHLDIGPPFGWLGGCVENRTATAEGCPLGISESLALPRMIERLQVFPGGLTSPTGVSQRPRRPRPIADTWTQLLNSSESLCEVELKTPQVFIPEAD